MTMPISVRNSGIVRRSINRVVRTSSRFFFVGSYNMSLARGSVVWDILRKTGNNNLFSVFLLPPPTDFAIWNMRRALRTAYTFSGPDWQLYDIVASDPRPAFAVLEEHYNNTGRFHDSVRIHFSNICQIMRSGGIVILEPHMHAKFIVGDGGIYEGSANLSLWGIDINVEVYHSMNIPSSSEYVRDKFQEYLSTMVRYLIDWAHWRRGSEYIDRVSELGEMMQSISSRLNFHVNPALHSSHISNIRKLIQEIDYLRMEYLLLPGLLTISKVDLFAQSARELLNRLCFSANIPNDDGFEPDSKQFRNYENIPSDPNVFLQISKKLLGSAGDHIKLLIDGNLKAHIHGFERDYYSSQLENGNRLLKIIDTLASEWSLNIDRDFSRQGPS